jgi:hypothetical protein
VTIAYEWRGEFENAAAFYFQACGFTPTSAGLIALAGTRQC